MTDWQTPWDYAEIDETPLGGTSITFHKDPGTGDPVAYAAYRAAETLARDPDPADAVMVAVAILDAAGIDAHRVHVSRPATVGRSATVTITAGERVVTETREVTR